MSDPRIAIVTGASAGLGYEVCKGLLAKGVRVAGFARSLDGQQGLAQDAFLPLSVDVADFAAVANAVQTVRETFGAPDILVNCAGVYPHRDILDETADSFMHTLHINLGGMVACISNVLPDMVARGAGHIVNVTSFAGMSPAPASAAYSVSKGACRIYTHALHADLSDRFPNIIISDWIPGALKTQMGIPSGIAPEVAAAWGVNLAMSTDPALSGQTFNQDQSMPPPQSLKKRVVNKLLGRKVPQVSLQAPHMLKETQ